MGDVAAAKRGIAGNGRGTGLLCASGTLVMRCSLIVQWNNECDHCVY